MGLRRALLLRHETSGQGTFGRIEAEGHSWFTGELPWKDNANDISCIPVGKFECRWTWSARFRRHMYEIKVPGRVGVRIHPANFMGEPSPPLLKQLHGCIALGEKLGIMERQKAVLVSQPAIRDFETLMGEEPFELEIRNEFG